MICRAFAQPMRNSPVVSPPLGCRSLYTVPAAPSHRLALGLLLRGQAATALDLFLFQTLCACLGALLSPSSPRSLPCADTTCHVSPAVWLPLRRISASSLPDKRMRQGA
jgi:hypothetical protein